MRVTRSPTVHLRLTQDEARRLRRALSCYRISTRGVEARFIDDTVEQLKVGLAQAYELEEQRAA